MPIEYKRKEVLPGVSSEHVIPALGVLEDSEGFYLFLWAPEQHQFVSLSLHSIHSKEVMIY